MKYSNLYKERNEIAADRYELAIDRIRLIPSERQTEQQEFFNECAQFIICVDEILTSISDGSFYALSFEEMQDINKRLYNDLFIDNYNTSFLNPDYANSKLGIRIGAFLSFLYSELRAIVYYAFELRIANITILLELFLEVYGIFSADEFKLEDAKNAVKSFFHDYTEWFSADAIITSIDPKEEFFKDIITNSDLSDLRYLYKYGSYISNNEINTAKYLNSLSADKIKKIADTYTEGYRIGFEVTGKDLSKKSVVQITYPIGFERVVKASIANFAELGLNVAISREKISSYTSMRTGKAGCYTTGINPQYDYDHQMDMGYFLDKSFLDRRLEVLRDVYEKNKDKAALVAGPAVIEVFGNNPFSPEFKEGRFKIDAHQQKLFVDYQSKAAQITNKYIIGEERSFTIIAFPIPEIGDNYEKIFDETIKINTLDYKQYQKIQQSIIDELDKADVVRVTGRDDNLTDLTIKIKKLDNPLMQTAFENCVADVNIPVGEVFTSPTLQGTYGLLHVKEVYLNKLKYTNLKIRFEDGMAVEYSCDNFDDKDESVKYVLENVLANHEKLPMGEFAIGTNTTAYKMAKEYSIFDRLPILIAEKTGPHFAVGDTCYSYAEDIRVYNPNSKEIVAKDNEISIKRRDDISEAYFNCHTDITIPFDELDRIYVVTDDGSTIDIINKGRFVLQGCDALNKPLDNQEE